MLKLFDPLTLSLLLFDIGGGRSRQKMTKCYMRGGVKNIDFRSDILFEQSLFIFKNIHFHIRFIRCLFSKKVL